MINFGLVVYLKALEDSGAIREWRNDPKIWRWTRQNDLISKERQVEWFSSQRDDPSVKMYQIHRGGPVPMVSDPVIGVCGFTSISFENRRAEFSLYIAPEYQGLHLSGPSLATLFYHGFMNLGFRSIWGETFDGNRALKLFKAIGMSEDGRRRDFYWKDGRFIDAVLITILDDEFFGTHGRASCF